MGMSINPKCLIFVHSLFRAGSTYLFRVFRRSELGYWCYQEPLHEMAVFSRENPLALQLDQGNEKAQLLRHPELDGSYFKELQETWPAWKDVITEPVIYDAYFLGEEENIGIPYWQALSEAARGRPVFQECRTSGRIGAIKSRMGGHHIYLWRNPWDQWWSYKVTPYFDVANQLILHANHAPQPVRHLLAALHLPAYEGGDLSGAFDFYGSRPPPSEQSYQVFYLLWCLALREGAQHADVLLNIDRLSDSQGYREETLLRLQDAGIDGIHFSDCRVPQGIYLEKDQDFFAPLEKQVHQWLIEGGWPHEELEQTQRLRQQYAPASWGEPIAAFASENLAEQASRARMLTCRFETTSASAQIRATQAEAKAEQAEAASNQHLMQLHAVYNSTSWRITAPLRWPMHQLRLLRQYGLKARFKALVKKIARKAIQFASSRPWLKRWGITLAHKLGLYSRLQQLHWSTNHNAVNASSALSSNVPSELSQLTPRARQIHADLKAAIAQRREVDR